MFCRNLANGIQIDMDISPIVHAPRKVPVALHNPAKAELIDMVRKIVLMLV